MNEEGNPGSGRGFFFSLILFRPFGSKLLDGKAAVWLTMMSIVVLLMATIEGLSWGFVASIVAPEGLGHLIGILVGIGFFLLIWILDASLVTFDRKTPEIMFAINRDSQGDETRREGVGSRKLIFGILARLGIIGISLIITAPFVSQFVFEKEVLQEIEAGSAGNIETGRALIEEKWAAAKATAREDRDRAVIDLEAELAGKYVEGSGKHGWGPVARSIDTRVQRTEKEFQSVEIAAKKETQLFDQAVTANDWEHLKSQYNVFPIEDSMSARWKALEAVRDRPEYFWTETAIRAFLGLIFLSLIMLKAFEPDSFGYYLSPVVQQEYDLYERGALDFWLPESQQSTIGSMPVHRFVELLITVIAPLRAREALARVNDLEIAERAAKIRRLDENRERLRSDRKEAVDEYTLSQGEVERASERRSEFVAGQNQLKREIADFQDRLAEIDRIRSEGHFEYELLEERKQLSALLKNRRVKLDEVKEDFVAFRGTFENAKRRQERLEKRVAAITKKLESVEQSLHEQRGEGL